jgi:hypothetical protein
VRIEVEASQDRGIEIPHAFRLKAHRIEVVEVLDQWYGPDYRYCKVKGGDGALYILHLDENRSEWHLYHVCECTSSGPVSSIMRKAPQDPVSVTLTGRL